ncbi:hypothetical protein FACS1894168_0770 [Deltaproteobacteria bacterium]|nr:hypothetical protein FACS1894168_0770 [Deltaproteobacteria bacterium]
MIPSPLNDTPGLYLAKEDFAQCGSHFLLVVEAQHMVSLAQKFLAAGFHLEDISGLMVSEGAVSVYHFNHFDEPCRCSILLIAQNGKFPSIASIYQGAEWHERETRDFFGFQYEGNPNFIPLLLADNMVDVHPLAKGASARATLATLFSPEGRKHDIIRKEEGFSLLDAPVKAEESKPVESKGENDA